MLRAIREAKKLDEFNQELPEVSKGDVVGLFEIWDGEGDLPFDAGSFSIKLNDMSWINYEYEVIGYNNRDLEKYAKMDYDELKEIKLKITGASIL